ncbi:DUF4172 domain-containing protein [Sphingobacterium corticibacter]|nr:DUF4172 domain-containing protein [Sphingobacterium corticibacter]
MYSWQFKNWPNFTYSLDEIHTIAISFAEELGLTNGLVTGLSEDLKQEAF